METRTMATLHPSRSHILFHTTPLACGLFWLGAALAQQAPFPPPGRTIFKCVQAGKTSYSDTPCLGAQALDIVVPRGLNKLSGTQRTGADVSQEIQHENFANAIRPLTGMTPAELKQATHRQPLSAAMKAQCLQLDAIIPQLELRERQARQAALSDAQRELFEARKQFQAIGC